MPVLPNGEPDRVRFLFETRRRSYVLLGAPVKFTHILEATNAEDAALFFVKGLRTPVSSLIGTLNPTLKEAKKLFQDQNEVPAYKDFTNIREGYPLSAFRLARMDAFLRSPNLTGSMVESLFVFANLRSGLPARSVIPSFHLFDPETVRSALGTSGASIADAAAKLKTHLPRAQSDTMWRLMSGFERKEDKFGRWRITPALAKGLREAIVSVASRPAAVPSLQDLFPTDPQAAPYNPKYGTRALPMADGAIL